MPRFTFPDDFDVTPDGWKVRSDRVEIRFPRLRDAPMLQDGKVVFPREAQAIRLYSGDHVKIDLATGRATVTRAARWRRVWEYLFGQEVEDLNVQR